MARAERIFYTFARVGKILILKHMAQENLGILKPVISDFRLRIQYVNFNRDPAAKPSLEKCSALVLLGGWMGVYESDQYEHIRVECNLVERALKDGIPILGICLGSQILAHVLGAKVVKHSTIEAGWQEVSLTAQGKKDPLFSLFSDQEVVFQMHGDTFNIPPGSTHLLKSENCSSQAFRFGTSAYGLQFHLEMDQKMIDALHSTQENRDRIAAFCGVDDIDVLRFHQAKHLQRSNLLARSAFTSFFNSIPDLKVKSHPRGQHGKLG